MRTITKLALSIILAIYFTNVLWTLAEQRRGMRELQTIHKMYKSNNLNNVKGIQIK